MKKTKEVTPTLLNNSAEAITIFRHSFERGFNIFVDNSEAESGNINIDRPTFFCFALSKAEAIGLMMLSDFEYKHKPIKGILEL